MNFIWKKYSFLTFILHPFSWLYNFINFIIRSSYKLGYRKILHFSIPIIIVGNLTVGGNGKTPMVIWLAKKLKKEKLKIGIISRGYKGKTKKYPLIINKNTSVEEAGDEAILIYQNTRVPCVVSPKRTDAVKKLLETCKYIDIIISDDGLQHYSLARDFEIIMIDGIRRFGNKLYLPAGPMRDSIKYLKCANVIINTEGIPHKNEIFMKLHPDNFAINVKTNEKKLINLFHEVVAIAGIGNPYRFFNTLEKCGILLIKKIIFSDHKKYKKKTLKKLTKKNQILMMTEKDAIKCKNFAMENWWYLKVHVEINPLQSKILIQKIKKLCK